jgi:putative ABC transport system permease protein
MKWNELFRLALLNLWRRKFRAVLTVLGVIIGTACIVVMVALGIGNMEQFNDEYVKGLNLTQIDVYMGYGGGSGPSSEPQGMTQAEIDAMGMLEGVKAVSPVINIPVYMKIAGREANMSLNAVDPAVLGHLRLSDGRLFSTDGSTPQIVLGSNVQQNFMTAKESEDYYRSMDEYYMAGDVSADDAPAPPQIDVDWLNEQVQIYLGGQWLLEDPPEDMPRPKMARGRVVGLLEASNSQESYNAYISLDAAKKLIKDNRKLAESQLGIHSGKYTQAIIQANEIEDVFAIVKAVKEMGYEAYSPTESIESVKEEQARQQSQLFMMAFISLFVSAIGIANTMMTSILERRGEIGVMKVIGLSIAKIRAMFVVESGLIGFVGGIIGVALSYILAWVLQNGEATMLFGMYFASGIRLVIPPYLVLAAMIIAVGVGILSGIYPAYRATRMSALEAIRSGG